MQKADGLTIVSVQVLFAVPVRFGRPPWPTFLWTECLSPAPSSSAKWQSFRSPSSPWTDGGVRSPSHGPSPSLFSRTLGGLGELCVSHSSALHPLAFRPGAVGCRTPGSGAHDWREITENIGVFACFPVVWIPAGGTPAPRLHIRIPPAFPCPRSGFHGFQCRHSSRLQTRPLCPLWPKPRGAFL